MRQILDRPVSSEECQKLLGCNKWKLKNHLQKRFISRTQDNVEIKMSWDNFGTVWEIDHIEAL